jgi:carboxypeptidase C (cathepsin A)
MSNHEQTDHRAAATTAQKSDGYTKPTGATSEHSIAAASGRIDYSAECDWIVLHKNEKPVAEVFYTYYAAAGENRPLTFVFNGGPGAASAYLHMGAVGPRRVTFGPDGTVPPPPVQLTDNPETWLRFTDLVFVDPVGTGFSRAVPEGNNTGKTGDDTQDAGQPGKEFWKIERDLASLGEFMSRFLSAHHRWDSPAYVAGESYGGYRAARLARIAQETHGIGLAGAILISPALEFTLLDASDYDVLPWITLLPGMALAALAHKRSRLKTENRTPEAVREIAEQFAVGEHAKLLVGGAFLDEHTRGRIVGRLADLIGLDKSLVNLSRGRISARRFTRELLREQGLVCGLYDATVTARDPFPDRDGYEGPDPTLRSIEPVFASGINSHLRRDLGVATDREYHLLSMEVNRAWQVDIERHALQSQIGATDDLRYAMSLAPHMRVRITHGLYDLVTPYFASERLARLIPMQDRSHRNLSLKHYAGGHMFYAWDASRSAFATDMREFYRASE